MAKVPPEKRSRSSDSVIFYLFLWPPQKLTLPWKKADKPEKQYSFQDFQDTFPDGSGCFKQALEDLGGKIGRKKLDVGDFRRLVEEPPYPYAYHFN